MRPEAILYSYCCQMNFQEKIRLDLLIFGLNNCKKSKLLYVNKIIFKK